MYFLMKILEMVENNGNYEKKKEKKRGGYIGSFP